MTTDRISFVEDLEWASDEPAFAAGPEHHLTANGERLNANREALRIARAAWNQAGRPAQTYGTIVERNYRGEWVDRPVVVEGGRVREIRAV